MSIQIATTTKATAAAMDAIEQGMKPFTVTVSDEGDFIRVWNPHCGAIMGKFNNQLDDLVKSIGATVRRERTVGNGMINMADWEDRVRFA